MAQSRSKSKQRAIPRKTGRPLKLTQQQVMQLRTIALKHPYATAGDLRRLLAEQTGVQLGHQTLYRYLPKAGLKRMQNVGAEAKGGQAKEATGKPVASVVSAAPPSYGYRQRHRDPGDDTRYPSCLTDAEWELVADLFEHHGPGKPARYPRRLMVDACCYVVRTGCPWRLLPKDFPAWQDVYAHFRRWTEKGLFESMHDRLRDMWRKREGRQEAPTAAVVDPQSVKTSAQGGPKGFDAGKKVKGRKRHLVVDVLGLLLAVLVHPASVQDRDGASPVVEQAVHKYPTLKKLYVDGSYTGQCAQGLRDRYDLDVEVVRRPSKSGSWSDAQLTLFTPAPKPFPILPRCWVIERTHSWVERPRRLSKDYDRRLEVSTAWVWLAEARLLLRRLTDTSLA